MGSIVFLPSVNTRNTPKLYSKMTHLYRFKLSVFRLYWPSEAGPHESAASLGRRTHDFKEITRKIRVDFIPISPGRWLGGAHDAHVPAVPRARGRRFLRC